MVDGDTWYFAEHGHDREVPPDPKFAETSIAKYVPNCSNERKIPADMYGYAGKTRYDDAILGERS